MNIADGFLDIFIWFVQILTSKLPTSISFFTIETYQNLLAGIKTFLLAIVNSVAWFLPMSLILTLFKVMIFSYLALFGFKIVKFALNLLRGAGA